MLSSARPVVLFGRDSNFFEYASFHLAAAGLLTVPVLSSPHLADAIRESQPCAVLLHWDTLGDACLRACALLKAGSVDGAPVVILVDKLGGSFNIVAAFASGADGLIEGALNPRIFLQRLRTLIETPALAAAL